MRSIPSVGKQWIGLLLVIPVSTVAAADDASLAQQTLNPVASLISVPVQINIDDEIVSAALPTADERLLGSDKWNIGPTVVVLKQENGWTYGALANHLFSVAGDDDRPDVEATFVQPFLSYTTATLTSVGINTESTYDWEAESWSVPINLTLTQLLRVGRQPLSLSLARDTGPTAPPVVRTAGAIVRL